MATNRASACRRVAVVAARCSSAPATPSPIDDGVQRRSDRNGATPRSVHALARRALRALDAPARLPPRQHAVGPASNGETERLRAREPLLRGFGDVEQRRLELRALPLEDERLAEPAQDLAAGDREALARRGDEALVEVTHEHLLDDVPRRRGAEQVLDVLRVEDPEGLVEQLHDL